MTTSALPRQQLPVMGSHTGLVCLPVLSWKVLLEKPEYPEENH